MTTTSETKIACPSCEGRAPSRSAMRAQMTVTGDPSGAREIERAIRARGDAP